jgi:RimJ/RimL family protein N-acetyltransferase
MLFRRRTPAPRLPLDDGTVLRLFTVDDADALARTVRESLDHLRPWMPWAGDDQSADPAFQRERLARVIAGNEEWQYGLFSADGRVLGSFGLMTRRGPGTLEIGYFLAADAVGHGHATRAAGALTDVARRVRGVREVLIYCDEANVRSAAIPKRLGYRLDRVETRPAEAPAETDRTQVWVMRRQRSDRRGAKRGVDPK